MIRRLTASIAPTPCPEKTIYWKNRGLGHNPLSACMVFCLDGDMLDNPWIGIECEWREAPDVRALAHAITLVTAAREAGFPPESAATGKWLSVCLFWDGGRTEVEVFDDRYELYFLPRPRDDDPFNVLHLPLEKTGTVAALLEKIKQDRSTLRG